jgi:D-alanyl-D-alanine carboxypeptidase
LIIQALTGRSIETELDARLLAPLSLHNTRFDVGGRTRTTLAHGYTLYRGRNTDVTSLSPSAWWAAGAIVSTAADIARFYHALLRGALLPSPLLRVMTSVIPNGELGGGAGLGIVRTRQIATLGGSFAIRCRAGWGHAGQIDGYLSAALANRDASRQYVILVNEDPAALPGGAAAATADLANIAFC